MPGQDRTGPLGQGSLTGRGLGICGRGSGFRKGFGRGFAFGTEPMVLTKEQEKKILEAELAEVEAQRTGIQKALNEFK